MANIAKLLTEHMAIWTAADTEKKSGRGRASGNAGNVYGVKKLRELILELAVRGKLVPQDPNDEPANELLKRIQAERAKLIAEGKLKKEKPLAPIGEDEKSFELPKGWEWVRVSNLAEIKGGKRLPEGKTFSPVKTSNIYIQVTNMKHGTVIEESLKYIDDETKEILKNYTISSEDLYITIAGTIGDVGTVPENFNGMILTENAAKIVFNILDKNWFKHCFSSNFLREQFQEKTIQLAQPKLALHRVASSVIALPPLDEQHRIVAKVDELMALCDQLEQQHSTAQEAHETLVSQLLATLTQSQNAAEFNANWQRIYAHFDVLFTTEASIDALKQTLLQLAVMGKLVPQDPNDEPASELLKRIQAEKAKLIAEGKLKKEKPLAPIDEDEKQFKLPKGWEWISIQEVTMVITDGTHHTPNYIDSGVPFISVKDINGKTISFDDCKYISEKEHQEINARCNPEVDDILLCRIGTLGRPTIVDTNIAFSLFVSVGLLKLPKTVKIQNYLHRVLSSPMMYEQYDKIKAGGSHTNKLNLGEIPKLLIPLPPISEQHRIVAKVDALMALCDQLKTRIQKANQQQQAIADALVGQAVE